MVSKVVCILVLRSLEPLERCVIRSFCFSLGLAGAPNWQWPRHVASWLPLPTSQTFSALSKPGGLSEPGKGNTTTMPGSSRTSNLEGISQISQRSRSFSRSSRFLSSLQNVQIHNAFKTETFQLQLSIRHLMLQIAKETSLPQIYTNIS